MTAKPTHGEWPYSHTPMAGAATYPAPLTEAMIPADWPCSARFTASDAPAVKPGRNSPKPSEIIATAMVIECKSCATDSRPVPVAAIAIPHKHEARGPSLSVGMTPHWANNVAMAPAINTSPIGPAPALGLARRPSRSSTRKPTMPSTAAWACPPSRPATSHGLSRASRHGSLGISRATSAGSGSVSVLRSRESEFALNGAATTSPRAAKAGVSSGSQIRSAASTTAAISVNAMNGPTSPSPGKMK